MQYNFVYRTENKVNGKYYYGVHSTKDLGDGYLGSGVALKKAIRKYGKPNFYRTILAFFPTPEEAYEAEKSLVTRKELSDLNCYNETLGGRGVRYEQQFQTKGRVLITTPDRSEEKRVLPEELKDFLNAGWIRGRIKGLCTGYRHINDGIQEKKVNSEDLQKYLEQGWKEGRLEKWKPTTLGRIIISKDSIEKKIFPEELEFWKKQGWKRGRVVTTKGKVYMNREGKITCVPKDLVEQKILEGWTLGRSQKSYLS